MVLDNKIGKIIGCRINTLLAEKNLLQKNLAERLGVKKSTISYFISGKRIPNAEQLVIIADFFNVSTDYLLGRSCVKTTNWNLAFVCAFLQLDVQSVERIRTFGIIPALPHRGFYWDDIVTYVHYTDIHYVALFNKNLRAFFHSKLLTEIICGCTLIDISKSIANDIKSFVDSGVSFNSLSSFEREKLQALYNVFISLMQKQSGNLYEMERELNRFITSVTPLEQLNGKETRETMRIFKRMVNEYEQENKVSSVNSHFESSFLEEAESLLGYNCDDYNITIDCIRKLLIPQKRFYSILREIGNLNEQEIDEFIKRIDDQMKKKGYKWSDIDSKLAKIKDEIDNFYKEDPELFEAVYNL